MQDFVIYTFAAAIVLVLNDLVFRAETRKDVSLLRFYLHTALTSGTVVLIMGIVGKAWTFSTNEWLFGCATAIVSFFTYLLMLMGMKKSGNPIVGIIVFRLNLIPAGLLAVLFLGESICLHEALGLMFCVISIGLFSISKAQSQERINFVGLVICVCAMFFAGALNFLNKLAMMFGCDPFHFLVTRFFVTGVLSAGILAFRNFGKPCVSEVRGAALSGLLMVVAIYFVNIALRTGDIGFVIPITQMSFIVTTVVCALIYRQRLKIQHIVGLGCAALSIALVV